MAREWEHTHVNSSGWTSAQDVNAQPCTPALSPMSFQESPVPLWLCSLGSEAALPHSKASDLHLPYPSLLCAMAWILNHAPFCHKKRPRRFKKPRNPGEEGQLLNSQVLCWTAALQSSCRALNLAQIPCTDDPKFPAPSPVPAWCMA